MYLPSVPLAPGSKLGLYEIVAPLGAGGMGEVYRAHDARLDRDVAIKVLSKAMANDASAMARFEREATSVARLSHPNILSIFEFGQDDAQAFVVMELVDGETLRARLSLGPIAPRKAVNYALQIAKGLGAAHSRGIVHRDLKPENVMVTRDDHVKILDFGLAKTTAPVSDGSTVAATQLAGTTPGTVLGTFGYMAPEQVRGLAVDHRADMFAFGAVLYEMLSGNRAFVGATAADTMSAILTKEPVDLDLGSQAIPPGLDRIVRRCLEKTPELRFQSASDLAFALESLTSAPGSGATTNSGAVAAVAAAPVKRGGSNLLPWAVASIALISAVVGWWPRGASSAVTSRFETFARVTELAGEETTPSLSPDGTTVAYAVRVNDSWDIYAQRVGGRNATPILNDPKRDEGGPAFSPDGASIAFHESDIDGGIFVAGATGESVRRVTEFGFHPAWSPDGRRIAFTTEEINDPAGRQGEATLYIVDQAGGTPKKVVDGDAVQPSWSSNGRIVYWSNTTGQRDIYSVSADGGQRVALTNDSAIDWCPVWSPDGQEVYFASDRGGARNLWRIAVDPSSGNPLGEPEAVTLGAQATAGLPSFSKDGRRLVFRSKILSINPFEIPFDPVTLKAGEPRLLDSRINIRIPSSVSKDGSLIAYFSIGEQQEDLFVGPPGGAMRRVIDDAARDRAGVLTPDGKSLLFYSNRSGSWQPWMIDLDGSNLRQIGNLRSATVYPLISPRGDAVVTVSAGGADAFMLGLAPGSPPSPLSGMKMGDVAFAPLSWSADGTRLGGTLATSSGGVSGVAFYDIAAKTTTKVSSDSTAGVQWLADSRRLMYFAKDGWQLVVVDTATQSRTVIDVRLTAPSTDDVFAISPDNRHIYYGGSRAEADIWILERK